MQENFTTNDLIKYIYKETSLTETLEIGAALEEDFDLLQQFKSLMKGYMQLPKATFSPSPMALQNIIGYNSQQFVETT